MSENKIVLVIGLMLMILLVTVGLACSDGDSSDDDGKIGVVVTLLPQAEFVEAVGGDKVSVTVMVPPGADPHFYEPLPSQMVAVDKAEAYAKVGSGVEFEIAWLDKVLNQNNDIAVIDCSQGVKLIGMESEETEHEHEGGMDPHIWMSPANAKIMVENICQGLSQIDPQNKSFYEANRDDYVGRLLQLDEEIRQGLADIQSRTFMVYHPSFGYFAYQYDLRMISVEEEGKEPTAATLAKLIDVARDENIRVIFTTPQFAPENAEIIAHQVGAQVVSIDPLARDYITNMQGLANELIGALE